MTGTLETLRRWFGRLLGRRDPLRGVVTKRMWRDHQLRRHDYVIGAPRPLRPEELALVRALLESAPDLQGKSDGLESLLVREMNDGGMGSLYFGVERDWYDRQLGRLATEAQFTDADGVIVLVALNLDKDGDLYELDVWKTDSSRLIEIPELSKITIKQR